MNARQMRLFASSAPGLEELLEAEVRALGVSAPTVIPGGVEFEGSLELVYRANLELGLAQQLRLRIAEFPARRFPQLVRGVAAVDWRTWMAPGVGLRVRVSAKRSRLFHTAAIEERVRRGIEEALGTAPGEDVEGAWRLHVRMHHDLCTLSLDTSGDPLHRRGYRLQSGKAPLREDLARALIIASGWDRASPLVDPLMGAGTIPIEAAFLARERSPGVGRRFAFMDAPGFDEELWGRVLGAAKERELASLPFRIVGSDRDAGALEAARANAERASVLADLDLELATLGQAPGLEAPLSAQGALVTHPPYGKRIGKVSTLRDLYRSVGARLEALPPEWSGALVVPAEGPLGRALGVKMSSVLLTDQGGIKIRILRRRA